MMNNSTHEFERLLGRAALALWSDLPRDVQERLFEQAVAGEVILRNHLASYLHDHHPKTAHPAKPTQLAWSNSPLSVSSLLSETLPFKIMALQDHGPSRSWPFKIMAVQDHGLTFGWWNPAWTCSDEPIQMGNVALWRRSSWTTPYSGMATE
jgi:hypothetical protein